MATDIPPHNFNEVAGAIDAYIDNPEITVEGLLKYIKGPDFPTSGVITDKEEIREIYETGHGSVELAGKMSIEEKSGRKDLIITEIPYRVVKSKLVEELTNLYLNGKNKYSYVLQGIKEVRDESSKEGIRVVIELFRDANIEAIKTAIYNSTMMRVRIKINMTVLVKNHPRVLSLKDLIVQYVLHRREVIIRRTQFDLDKALARIHIVLGLIIAVDNIEEVIKIIKTSKDIPSARINLQTRFKLSEIQSEAIVEMRIGKLTGLETSKLKEEKEMLDKVIAGLREILASSLKRDNIIKSELEEMKAAIGDERKTKFEEIDTERIDEEELISNDPMLLTVSKKGFLIREVGTVLKTGLRGGKGKRGDTTDASHLENDDYIFATLSGNLKDTVLFVTDAGRVYSLKGYEIKGDNSGKITRSHTRNIERLKEIERRGESISSVLVASEFNDNNFLLFVTRKGKGARIALSNFDNINRTGINGIKLRPGDNVVSAVITDGNKKLFIVKKNAKGFKFDEKLFPVHNRGVMGEKATTLRDEGDEVLGMALADDNKYVMFITKDGRGRKIKPGEFSERENRGGKGFKLLELGKGRYLANFTICDNDDAVIITTKNGRRVSFTVDKIETHLLKLIDIVGDDEVSTISSVRINNQDQE